MRAAISPELNARPAAQRAEALKNRHAWKTEMDDEARRSMLLDGLRDRLGETGLDAPSYARTVLFYDGSNEGPCLRPRVHAFTAPGSRVVRVCPSLGRLAAAEPGRAESIVIHEVLHTLGLAENPPTSDDITAAVERRCRP